MDFFSKFSEFRDEFSRIQDEWNEMNRGRGHSEQKIYGRGIDAHYQRKNPFAGLQEQKYDEILAKCQEEGIMFEDPEFEAEDNSIFFSQDPPRPFDWLRPHVSAIFMQAIFMQVEFGT